MNRLKSKEKKIKEKKDSNTERGDSVFIYGVIIAVFFAIVFIIAEEFVLAIISFAFIIGLGFVVSELYYDISDLSDKVYKLQAKIDDLHIDEKDVGMTKKAVNTWRCSCGEVNEEHVIFCKTCGKVKSNV